MCFEGKVKHYPDPSKALYDLVKCPYCNGKGVVPKEKLDLIESQI